MQVHLDYGRTGIDVQLPEEHVVGTLAHRQVAPLSDPLQSVRQAISHPTGTPPLAELARGRSNACIAICDVTRPVPNELILRPILETLEASGMDRRHITILVATGLHRPNEGEELVEMVGRFLAENYRIENHHGQQLQEHTHLGDSPRGVPIWIDSRYVEAELKIAVGLIEPHFMAGYSGGRKVICPGLAALPTIKVWHSPRFLEHPRAASGVLEGNPVHEENTAMARKAGCDMIANVVIDAHRRPLKFVAGDMEAAFEEGVDFVRGVVTDTVPESVDVVVTSSAGYPLDTTFYQSVKGLVGALPIVKEGGTIVMAADMSQGIGGPEFQQGIRENPTLEGFMDRILGENYFFMDQWQLEELAKVARKADIKVFTEGLPAETLKRLYVEPVPSVESGVADALNRHGPDATLAVIPKGPYVLAQVGPSSAEGA